MGVPPALRGGVRSLTAPEIDETPCREPLNASRESQLSNYRTLQHTAWACKYHIVFVRKCRRKVLYWALRKHLGENFQRLAQQKECEIEEGGKSDCASALTDNARPSRRLPSSKGWMLSKCRCAMPARVRFGRGSFPFGPVRLNQLINAAIRLLGATISRWAWLDPLVDLSPAPAW
jgi:hypothetical protein